MLAGFQLLNEWPVYYCIHCIHYIIKIFFVQGIHWGLPEAFLEIVSSPNPNTCVRERSLDFLAEVDNSSDILVCQRLAAKNREVAMDAVLFQRCDYLVDNVFC